MSQLCPLCNMMVDKLNTVVGKEKICDDCYKQMLRDRAKERKERPKRSSVNLISLRAYDKRTDVLLSLYNKRKNSEHPGVAEAAERIATDFTAKRINVQQAIEQMNKLFVPSEDDFKGIDDTDFTDYDQKYFD